MTTQNKKQATPGDGPEAAGEADANQHLQSDYTPDFRKGGAIC